MESALKTCRECKHCPFLKKDNINDNQLSPKNLEKLITDFLKKGIVFRCVESPKDTFCIPFMSFVIAERVYRVTKNSVLTTMINALWTKNDTAGKLTTAMDKNTNSLLTFEGLVSYHLQTSRDRAIAFLITRDEDLVSIIDKARNYEQQD